MIDTWEIRTVYLTLPNGEVDVMDEGSYYHREEFLSPVDQLSTGKFYLMGFGSNLLCRVDNFNLEEESVHLTQIADLSENEIQIIATDEPHKFELQITNLKYEVRIHPDTYSWWGIYCHETQSFFHSKWSNKEGAEAAMQRLIDTGSLVSDAVLY
jgi:hypothetical protein